MKFAVSLPHSLLSAISLMCAADEYEGLGEWLYQTRARLQAEVYAEICTVVRFPGLHHRFFGELAARLPHDSFDMNFDQFIEHLRTVPGVHYQLIALRALARGSTLQRKPVELLELSSKSAEWAAFLREIGSEVAPDVVATLVRKDDEMKNRLLRAVERFWWDVYAEEFQATLPLLEQSVAHHHTENSLASFRETFTRTTGRLLPEAIAELLPKMAAVTYLPSCYVGPYVAYIRAGSQLLIFYNCRSTLGVAMAVDGASLYPPLKALSDETRLQILSLLRDGELYAQEIVNQLGISQPAVSRHLNLMAAAGVLQIRREGNAKFYSVNRQTLIRLADALRALS
jgi:hypothetical protein